MRKYSLNLAVSGIVVVIILALISFTKCNMPAREKAAQKEGARYKRDTAAFDVKNLKGEVDIQNAFIKVADTVGKAVVTISTERTQRVGIRRPQFRFKRFGGPFDEDPLEKFFEDFFGQLPEEKEFKQKGLGSGFIIDTEGHILTNHHVIEGADKINITLSDGRSFPGTVRGADPRSDLAVIKVDAENLPTVELGNSNRIQIGEWVVALGNPFGHILRSPEPTVTVGVVSALHRRIPTAGGERGYLDMIQTDAAINPGNSGGPLCNLDGRVIGINVAIFSTSGGYQGVGFAIPIDMAKDVLVDLIAGKEIAYGWLGVSVQEITPDMAAYFNLPDQKGALISQVMPNGPAEKGGLKPGDIVIGFHNKEVTSIHDLLREVMNAKVGQVVRVDLIRDRVKMTVDVTIGKKPVEDAFMVGRGFVVPEEIEKWRGIKVSDITDEIAKELELQQKDGVVVVEVDSPSPSYDAGLREGDVVREINKTKIKNISDYKKITNEAKGIVLIRTDRSGYITIKES